MQMLPRTLPETLDDLTVQVALVRPGPIQGGAVHPYIERRKRLREDPDYEVPYEHPSLEPILADTLGAIVFQDQVIQVAMALAGFSAGEAEGLRRAMSRKRSEAAMRGVRGAVHRRRGRRAGWSGGWPSGSSSRCAASRASAFPKSHAAAFGLLAYQSTWLRVHYGPEFLCALLNEQPMGFYPPDSLVHEAQRRGIEVRPADVNASGVECTVEAGADEPAVRIGLGYIKGIAEEEVRALVDERRRGPLPRPRRPGVALGGGARRPRAARLGGRVRVAREWRGSAPRREELWRLGIVAREPAPARACPVQLSLPLSLPAPPDLRPLDSWERIVADYALDRVTLGEHPMELLRPELGESVLRTRRARDDARTGRGARSPGWSSPASAPRPRRGSCSCCSRTSSGVVNLIVPPPVYERPAWRCGRPRSRSSRGSSSGARE